MKNIVNKFFLVLVLFLISSTLWIDYRKSSTYLLADEATYYGMALSLAYDHDLVYSANDFSRITAVWSVGPHGIFLKKNKPKPGPEISNDLIEGCGLTWRYPCKNLAEDGEFCEL